VRWSQYHVSSTLIFLSFPQLVVCNDKFSIHRCYYFAAQLFRKDLISAMKLADSEALRRDDYVMISDHWRQDWEKGVQVPVNPDALKHGQVAYVDVSFIFLWAVMRLPNAAEGF